MATGRIRTCVLRVSGSLLPSQLGHGGMVPGFSPGCPVFSGLLVSPHFYRGWVPHKPFALAFTQDYSRLLKTIYAFYAQLVSSRATSPRFPLGFSDRRFSYFDPAPLLQLLLPLFVQLCIMVSLPFRVFFADAVALCVPLWRSASITGIAIHILPPWLSWPFS